MTSKAAVPLILILSVLIAGAAMAFYYIADPATDIMPRCLFNLLTGWKCPGCGSQRMIHALLHGDFASAWSQNAFLILLLPLLLLIGGVEIFRKHFPTSYKRIHSPLIITTILVLTILWWILRNIFTL